MVTRRPLVALALAALLSTIAACGFTGEPDPGWVNGHESADAGAQPPPNADLGVEPEPGPDMFGVEPADMSGADATFDAGPDAHPDAGSDAGPECPPDTDAGADTDADVDAPDSGLDPCAPDDTADGGADAQPELDADQTFDPIED